MKIKEIAALLNGKIVCGENYINSDAEKAFASDLMSDVLRLKAENIVLLTGLCNIQTIRTCEMADINFIVLARDKEPTADMIELAEDNGMVILQTSYSLFKASGILYGNGLSPIF